MATTLTEGPYAGEFILSEANGDRSRDNITVELQDVADNGIDAGTVLGMRASDGKYLAYDDTATDGTETVAGILYGPIADLDGGGDVAAVIVNADAEVIGEKILGPTGAEDDVETGLAALGIKVRGDLDFS